MSDHTQCFLDKDRLCTRSCVAYDTDPLAHKFKCRIINLCAVSRDLLGILPPESKHPTSPPAPEIKR